MKKKFGKTFWLIAFFLTIVLEACSDSDSESVTYVKPDNSFFYWLYPNDGAVSDSVDANLTHGVLIPLHPQGSYQLSFDVDSAFEAPELQLYRYYRSVDGRRSGFNNVRVLEPEIRNGRYVYSFVCDEKEKVEWVTTLALDDDFYPGKVRNVRVSGEGPYSDTLSINLVVVGKVNATEDGVGTEELGKMMLEYFRKFYTSISFDTLYIRYAHEHPTLGNKYPADEPWLAGRSSEDIMLSELGGWPEDKVKNALDIVYMHRIELDEVIGYSSLFAGNLGGGVGSTVIVGNRVKTLSGDEELSKSEEIVQSTLHEVGHYFGLRHTTTTMADVASDLDYSILEDGFEDTPYCPKLQQLGLLKRTADESGYGFNLPVDYYRPYLKLISVASAGIRFTYESCQDASNYMFPVIMPKPFESFSKQQLAVIRKNLSLFPH